MSESRRLVRLADVARELSRTPSSVRALVQEDELLAAAVVRFKRRGWLMFDPERLDAWLAARRLGINQRAASLSTAAAQPAADSVAA
jgi:streptomycin 6-kinase